jgi:hypothetical protein
VTAGPVDPGNGRYGNKPCDLLRSRYTDVVAEMYSVPLSRSPPFRFAGCSSVTMFFR